MSVDQYSWRDTYFIGLFLRGYFDGVLLFRVFDGAIL